MAKIRYGRDARLYAAPVTYTGGVPDALDKDELIEITRLGDITSNDETASEVVAGARDLEYDVFDQSEKRLVVETKKLINVEESGDDVDLLRDAFDAGDELWVLLTRKAKSVASGDGLLCLCQLFGWPEELPQSGAVTAALKFMQSNPDRQPERVGTPVYADSQLRWVYSTTVWSSGAVAAGRMQRDNSNPLEFYLSRYNAFGVDITDLLLAVDGDYRFYHNDYEYTTIVSDASDEDDYLHLVSDRPDPPAFSNGDVITLVPTAATP